MKLQLPLSLLGLLSQKPTAKDDEKSLGASRLVAEDVFQLKHDPDIFSPQDAIELGRPGVGIANEAGDIVLVPYDQYSLSNRTNSHSLVIVSLNNTEAEPFDVPGEAFWLDSRTFGQAVTRDDYTDIYTYTVQVQDTGKRTPPPISVSNYEFVGSIPANTASQFHYSKQSRALFFTAEVYADRNLTAVNEHDRAWDARGDSALIFESLLVRFWDTWSGPKTTSPFSVSCKKGSDGKWTLGSEWVNLLGGANHTMAASRMGEPVFSVARHHLLYLSEPGTTEQWSMTRQIHIVDIDGSSPPRALAISAMQRSMPTISQDGSKAIWLEEDEAEGLNRRPKFIFYDILKNQSRILLPKWDRGIETLTFSENDDFLYFTAGDRARTKVFALPVPPSDEALFDSKYQAPVALTHSGSASGLQILNHSTLLFTKSSFTSPNDLFVIHGIDQLQDNLRYRQSVEFTASEERVTHFTAKALKGKTFIEPEEFWFKGANGTDVQGWVFRPYGWTNDSEATWPAALNIHGGPQSAWEDAWSTRWNPVVFAQQGYFVVMINPTGSTTFGYNFSNAVKGDWGGKPFIDLQEGWKHVLKTYPEIDTNRTVAAGGSYGGYAINWILGHPEYEFDFKALVNHDGVFDIVNLGYASDVPAISDEEWGGKIWNQSVLELIERHSPRTFVKNWSIPTLIIHGSKDYRVPETEGIAAFQALQQLGVPSRLMVFPDENHWTLKHENSLKWHHEVFRWFDLYVGKK